MAPVGLHVLRWADAGVIPQGVVAGPGATHTRVCKTLIDVFTDAGLLAEVVALRALALEAAERVDAVPALAETW